ncbi:hypothetical protein [Neobacillus sp. 19]
MRTGRYARRRVNADTSGGDYVACVRVAVIADAGAGSAEGVLD